MSLLALELSDAGIMVAATDPARLVEVDGGELESPGYALPINSRLLVGSAAERQAHLFPRDIINHFWDQLNTEPLTRPISYANNHADVAFDHLAHIWEKVKLHGNEMVVAVPGFLNRDHMGLLLGITRELSIPLRGFVSQGVFATPNDIPEGLLLHVDIHLHRAEVVCLKREEDTLTQLDAASIDGCGMNLLFKEWVNWIAEEFVLHTRFDPLHKATFEQELYDRLPWVLDRLRDKRSVDFEMMGSSKKYYATLTRKQMIQKSVPLLEPLNTLVNDMVERQNHNDSPISIQFTHRVSSILGFKEALSEKTDGQTIQLEEGAAAMGVIKHWHKHSMAYDGQGAPFLTSRTLERETVAHSFSEELGQDKERPTHVLYRHIAYPISEKPLSIGQEALTDGSTVTILGHHKDVALRHCTIQYQDNSVVLKDHSTSGTFVGEQRVSGKVILQNGQTIRLGESGETLEMIACRKLGETS